ncbi:hypothetical protein [Nocardia sp. XZ_19_231]|uniref:hypothetical protein n=1 Tax=Nocardia sp. XZ_19_231 TaxID=2769252 RepID=UPI00188E5BF6|nr:hypothetical protein [Nocardia sp. XZ_19_231]
MHTSVDMDTDLYDELEKARKRLGRDLGRRRCTYRETMIALAEELVEDDALQARIAIRLSRQGDNAAEAHVALTLAAIVTMIDTASDELNATNRGELADDLTAARPQIRSIITRLLEGKSE